MNAPTNGLIRSSSKSFEYYRNTNVNAVHPTYQIAVKAAIMWSHTPIVKLSQKAVLQLVALMTRARPLYAGQHRVPQPNEVTTLKPQTLPSHFFVILEVIRGLDTPIYIATTCGYYSMVKVLCNRGADIRIINIKGVTAFHSAALELF